MDTRRFTTQIRLRSSPRLLAGLLCTMLSLATVHAADATAIPLVANEVGTLHVAARIGDGTPHEFLLDTGSAYVVLSETTRRRLAAEGALTPLRSLRAVMANEATAQAQVYRVSSLRLGDGCVVRDFEAVALPGARKDILGLSVLRALAPFTVDVDPLRLAVNCTGPAVLAWSVTATGH